ncbi:MAG: 3D domain-containing protein [Acidobacteriota bacterium]|nr:MAG: 3D domain-containing protein [Acidobacteriota bacterium]
MRNQARRYVISVLFVLLVGVAYSQTQTEDDKVLTKDPKESIQNKVNKENTKTDNKEAVNKEAIKEKEDSEVIEAEVSATVKTSNSKARSFRATAYCLRGRTASGQSVRRGLIAADPRVLPLGTKVQLTAGRYSGEYIVADTGGKVKGNKIDIWVPNCGEARRWGNRGVKLTVMSRPTRRN